MEYEQENQHASTFNVRDILTTVFKHKFTIVLTALIIAVGATLVAFVFAPQPAYEAKSVLMVKQGREFTAQPEVGDAKQLSIPAQNIINSEISILMSRELIDTVIRTVGPERLFPGLTRQLPGHASPMEVASDLFQKNLRVGNIKNSNLIVVTFTHANPYLAAEAVNRMVDAFKEKHLEVFSSNSTAFLDGQQKVFQEKLKESEVGLADFKQKHRVFSLEEQRTALIGQRSALDTSLKAAQSQIAELEQKIALIRSAKWIADAPELRSRLAALQQREAEMLSKYLEGSRTVEIVRQEIEEVKAALKKSSQEARQIELPKAESELFMARTRADTMRRQIEQIEREILSLDARAPALNELKREATQQEQNYQTYARRLEEALIRDDMDRQKMVAISVVEKAIPSTIPKKEKFTRGQLVVGGLFGGIAAGIALAFLLESMGPGMTTPLSAERRLNVPVMVAIPKKA